MATTPLSNRDSIVSPKAPLRRAPRVQTHLVTVDAEADTGAEDVATGIVRTWPLLRSDVGLTQSAFVQDLLCSTVEHQPSATDPTLRQFVTKTTAQYPLGQDTYAYLSMVHEMPKIRQVHAISKDLVRNMNPIELRAARNKIKTEKRRNIILQHLHTHWQDASCHYAAEFNCPKLPQNVLECLKKLTDLAISTGTPLASLWAPEGPLRRAVNNHDPPKLTRSVAESALALALTTLNQELTRSPPPEPRSRSSSLSEAHSC
ncbi:hypothetical protein CTA2_1423, partial [Colletotrichum tanaceti]